MSDKPPPDNLWVVSFHPYAGPYLSGHFRTEAAARKVYDAAMMAREGFNTETQGCLIHFAFTDDFCNSVAMNLLNHAVTIGDLDGMTRDSRLVTETREFFAEKHGADSKVGIGR